ncbi:drebrin-like protein B isoform X2 [Lineus longissimus]|uniref:drebrin-like protein B isoform X2 n=1 Tax=Lineus longissimus TaxID=88925 RepID=UPI002B4E8F7B
MSVDLNKNKESLLAAWKEVTDNKSNTEWAIFGYEGNTNVLKVAETGDGDWDEMTDELSSGKCLYAFVQVLDTNTNLPKFVLINWQPDGAPDQRKAICARHTVDVARFFRGAHVSVNARCEDDIDFEFVQKKVAAASGSQYGIHKEQAKPMPAAGPVGSVYKRTMAAREINVKQRDEFWEKTEKDESRRIEVERKKSVQEKEEMERKRKEREEKDQVDAMKEDEERRNRSEALRKQRAAEAAALVQQRGANPRSMFQQMASTKPAPPQKMAAPSRKLKWEFEPSGGDQSKLVERKGPIRLPTEDEGNMPPRPEPLGHPEPEWQPEPARQPEPVREPSPEPVREPSPEPVREPSPEPVREPSPEPVREPSPEPVPVAAPVNKNLFQQGLPQRPDSDEEEEEADDWNDSEPVSAPVSAPVVEPEPEPQPLDNDAFQNNVVEENANEETKEIIIPPEAGLCCAALYDYQAEDDTEISFDPGDVITNVEQIDAGWWMGVGPDGQRGMFPANYVEVIN